MTYNKYIVTHEVDFGTAQEPGKKRFGNAYIIANCYDHSLPSFQRMIAMAKKAFPRIKDKEIECRTVIYSSWCKGCPVIKFPVPPDSQREGWTETSSMPDVAW
jgi:hypothetical protein